MRTTFYVVTFRSADTKQIETSRTFSTLQAARKNAKHYEQFATEVRVMMGGPGGAEVA